MVWVFHSFVKSQFMCIGRHRLQVSIDFFQANMPHQHSPGKWDRKYESLQIRESHTRVCVCGWSWCMPANRGQGPGLIGLLMACCKALMLFSLCTDIPHAFMCLGKNQNAIIIRNIINMRIQIYAKISNKCQKNNLVFSSKAESESVQYQSQDIVSRIFCSA